MIRKLHSVLQREGRWLLQELGAPDFRTLCYRIAFWTRFYVFMSIGLGGVMAVGIFFGLPAMYAVIFVIVLLALWMERRAPIYYGDDDWLRLGGSQPTLPPPHKPALPPSGTQALPPPGRRALPPTVRSSTGRRALPPP